MYLSFMIFPFIHLFLEIFFKSQWTDWSFVCRSLEASQISFEWSCSSCGWQNNSDIRSQGEKTRLVQTHPFAALVTVLESEWKRQTGNWKKGKTKCTPDDMAAYPVAVGAAQCRQPRATQWNIQCAAEHTGQRARGGPQHGSVSGRSVRRSASKQWLALIGNVCHTAQTKLSLWSHNTSCHWDEINFYCCMSWDARCAGQNM